MNRHAWRRLTETTLIELSARLKAVGNRTSRGGIPIEIPPEMVDHIHAFAYDVTRGIAAKAQLEPSPQWMTGPTRIGGEVVA